MPKPNAAKPPPPGTPPKPPIPPPPTGAMAAVTGTALLMGSLADITTPRVVLNCVEGWGKTSTGAFAPRPIILCAAGENGYQTLKGAGLVPDIPGANVTTWPEFLATLDSLAGDVSGFDTLVLDALGGFELLCHAHVCTRDFKSDWGEKGFASFQKGYDVALKDWIAMLAKLDKIHAQGVTILALSHVIDKTVGNPLGADFDRYVGSVHKKTWAITKRWADAVLFGTFLQVVTGKPGKEKGVGGISRVLYCEHRDAYDAKNRYKMPDTLDIPADPTQVWSTIRAAMQRKEA